MCQAVVIAVDTGNALTYSDSVAYLLWPDPNPRSDKPI